MPKGPPPRWTARDCRFDNLVAAVLGKGFGVPLFLRGIETADRAHDIKQGFYRCARHRQVSAEVAWIRDGERTTKSAAWPPDRQADGTFTLILAVHQKAHGQKHLIETMGADRAGWHYDPRRPKSQADIDRWAEQGLDEKGHRIR